ncbi:MAG: restriction endonuclease subunit S [Nitrospira sp.]|nr:restriction endonuclease subunit S [Nitrospira sp.]
MSGWQTKRLGDVLQLNYGKSLPVKSRVEGPIPVYGSNGVVGSHTEAIVDAPGLIVGRKGSAGQVHLSRGPFCPIDTTFYVTANDAPDTDLEFLFYLLQHINLTRIIGDVGVPGLNREMAYMEQVRFPATLSEQKKIAHILSTVQRAIEAQERIIQTTTELKKTLMHKLFTEGTRGEPQKQTEIGLIPESWEVMPLGAIAKIGNGSTPKRSNVGYWEYGNIPWLNSTKIHELFVAEADQFVTPLAVKECHLPRVAPNSLLIAITGQGKTLGNSAIVRFETCINQHLAYAQFHSEKIIPDFVLWFMQTRYDFLRSIAQAGGSTKGALTCGYLKTHLIPIPEKNEQNEIVNIFGQLENKQKVITRKRAFLQDIFRTLLHNLMTAKIRVHDLNFQEK